MPHDLVFIRALRDLAHSFEIETVAEWVQDQATVDILREVGIDLLQGYFCGEPKPAADFRSPPMSKSLMTATAPATLNRRFYTSATARLD